MRFKLRKPRHWRWGRRTLTVVAVAGLVLILVNQLAVGIAIFGLALLGLVLLGPSHPAYLVRRHNFYLGRELTRGHWGRDWVVRLFTRDRRYIERRVHEGLEPVPNPGRLSGCLHHVPYRDLQHQLEKMGRYARWGAEDLYERGVRASVWDLSLRPCGRFLRSYFLQGSCWDGRLGLVTSLLGGYTAFLKYAHLWALERRS